MYWEPHGWGRLQGLPGPLLQVTGCVGLEGPQRVTQAQGRSPAWASSGPARVEVQGRGHLAREDPPRKEAAKRGHTGQSGSGRERPETLQNCGEHSNLSHAQ